MGTNFYLYAKVPNGNGGFSKIRIAHLGKRALRIIPLVIVIHSILESLERTDVQEDAFVTINVWVQEHGIPDDALMEATAYVRDLLPILCDHYMVFDEYGLEWDIHDYFNERLNMDNIINDRWPQWDEW